MKRLFYILSLFFIVLLTTTSCGIIEIIRGYDAYVDTNYYGGRELKNKKFKKKFSKEMSEKLVFDKVYYNYYEDESIDYKRHHYLRFFPTGQYAFYTSPTKDIDINNLFTAACVGYYIVKKDNLLELETPTGNFNTASFRVIWKYKIKPDGLEKKRKNKMDNYPERFTLEESKDLDLEVQPNW